jgi:hypothetical protein
MPVKEMVEDKIAEEQKSEKSEMKWHDEENISVSLYDENNRDDSNRVVEGEPVKISIEELRTSENVGQLIRTRMNIEGTASSSFRLRSLVGAEPALLLPWFEFVVGIRLVLKFMHQTPLQSSHHVHGKKRVWPPAHAPLSLEINPVLFFVLSHQARAALSPYRAA